MSTFIIKPSSHEEWLKSREQGIGSSEVATILGLNKWESPYQLWRRRKGFDDPKKETFFMKAGHYLEDAVTRFWMDETGREVIKSSAGDWICVNKEKPFLRVSPDRTFWIPGQPKSSKNKGVLECKTTQAQIDADDIPKTWFCQVQYQLGVMEMTEGSLAWLSAGREFAFKDIALVPDFYGWMTEEIERFWVDNILGNIEPEITTVDDVLVKYARHTDGKIIQASPEIMNAYRDLKVVRDEIAEMEEKKEELEAKIKLAFGDAEAIAYGPQTLVTWKAAKDSPKFDSKSFKTDYPDLYNQYAPIQAGSRRFVIK